MGLSLRLLPKETFGRRMQYAFLSMAPEDSFTLRHETDTVEFDDVSHFIHAVRASLDAILKTLYYEEGRSKCALEPVNGIDCCRLDKGPSLYTIGSGDMKLLEQAGLDRCRYVTARGKQIPAWTHSAVDYALMVLEHGGPLGGGEYAPPWLAKATLFSNVRGVGVRSETRDIKVDLDSLGVTLLGGAIAFLGSHSMGGDTRLEFFLLPDAPSTTYSVLRGIMSGDRPRDNLAGRIARLMREFSTGFEQAIALAVASMLYEHEEQVLRLGVGRLSASGRLYTVSPGQRPMIRAGIPLSTLLYDAYEKRTIDVFNWFIDRIAVASRDRRRGVERSIVNTCLNDLYLQAQFPCTTGFIYDCARILVELSRKPESREVLGQAPEALLDRLDLEYSRMARRCRGL